MKSNYNFARQLLLPFAIIVAATFAVLFIFFNNSSAQEAPPSSGAQNINPPSEIFDRNRAIEIIKTKGGPGGCKTEDACTTFCNSNQETCITWAKDNGVISGGDFDKYIGFARSGGPGGCKTETECKSYCEVESHFNECTNFAEKQGIISKEDAAKARKTGPGGCQTSKECNAFCGQPQNQDTCVDFAVSEGFITADDAQKIRDLKSKTKEFQNKVEQFQGDFEKRNEELKPEIGEINPGFDEEKAKQILGKEGGPGGCKTFEECRAFCENQNNQETCFKFAEEHSLFKDKASADKIKTLIENGGPGGCKDEKACREFCENPDNFSGCLDFAQKNDLIKPEELEKAKRGIEALKNGGPAGCKTQQECQTVCQNPANQEACFNWAKSNGLISEEEARSIEESKKFREEFEQKKREFENSQGGFQDQSRQEGFQGQGFPQGFGPSSGGEGSFSECITDGMPASFVCAINGRGAPAN